MHYLDKLSSPDEVDSIVVVFLHARTNGEDVGVKDDVIGVKSHFADQQLVGSTADLNFAVCICGLGRIEHLSVCKFVFVIECVFLSSPVPLHRKP